MTSTMIKKLVLAFVGLGAAGGVAIYLLTIPLLHRLPKPGRVSMDGITTIEDAVEACRRTHCKAGSRWHMRSISLPENSPIPVSIPGIHLPGPLNEAWAIANNRPLR